MWSCCSGDQDWWCDATDPCENAAELGCGYREFADLAAVLADGSSWFGCHGIDCEGRVGDEYDSDGSTYRPGKKPQWLPSKRNDGTGRLFCSAKCLRQTKQHWARLERGERDWLRCAAAIWPAAEKKYSGVCGIAGSGGPHLPRGTVVLPTYSFHAALGVEAGHYADANVNQWAAATGNAPLKPGLAPEVFEAMRAALLAWVESEDRPARGVLELWNQTQAELGLLARWAPKELK